MKPHIRVDVEAGRRKVNNTCWATRHAAVAETFQPSVVPTPFLSSYMDVVLALTQFAYVALTQLEALRQRQTQLRFTPQDAITPRKDTSIEDARPTVRRSIEQAASLQAEHRAAVSSVSSGEGSPPTLFVANPFRSHGSPETPVLGPAKSTGNQPRRVGSTFQPPTPCISRAAALWIQRPSGAGLDGQRGGVPRARCTPQPGGVAHPHAQRPARAAGRRGGQAECRARVHPAE
eukprot:857885-Prorocentrum_minimum.AAC.1